MRSLSGTRAERRRYSPERLDELRRKVHDESYISGAIQRIAQVLSAEIMNGYGVDHVGRKSR
ncbi:MAG: hypothetical protein NT080_08010 [Spirochaetes bacterium]|nr:hypothetical protein [Spirochaetota bacterium]